MSDRPEAAALPAAVRTLLAALHRAPSDHAARLALADALEEVGRLEQAEVARLHARQLMRVGTREELDRLCALLTSGVRPVVPEVVNSVGMRLALIPAGKFQMGSPPGEEGRDENDEPQHEVELTRPFYLGVYPVTQAEYEGVMEDNPSYFAARGGGKDKVQGLDTRRFPVENVSHDEAMELCRRLTERERKGGQIGGEQAYRLPTEAEWEYSCRGGAASYQTFHFGATLSHEQANFERHLGRTCAVGSYPPNGYGLYDLHGNVWEWCADRYGADTCKAGPFPRRDPLGPRGGSDRVFRGGSWLYDGRYCRSARRGGSSPGLRLNDLGFRVALVPPGGK